MRKVTIVALALLLIPGISQAKTLEDLLVEKGVVSESDLRSDAHMGSSKTYWKGGTRLDFPDNGFTAKINTQLQPRYEFTDNDEGTDNTSSFSLRRARLQVEGTALNSEFKYRLQAEFKGSPELKDAWVQWSPCDIGGIKFGQFKPAQGRQFNNSSSKLQFPDRSFVADAFDLDRQHGAGGTVGLADGMVVLDGQIFNGESDGEGDNRPGVDTGHTAVVGARVNVGSIKAHEEGDIGWSDELGMSFGGSYAYSDKTVGGIDLEDNTITADMNFKVAGASLHAELFYREEDSGGAGSDAEPLGFYAQAGYFIMPKTFEIALRGAYLDCDDGAAVVGDCAGNEDMTSAEASLNYFFWKHNLKAQLAFAFLEEAPVDDAADETDTNRVIFQVSTYF